MTAVVATLLAALTSSPAPARAGDGSGDRAGDRTGLTGAEWHRLHPALCHTVGEHPRDY